jgi:hypothetical protein
MEPEPNMRGRRFMVGFILTINRDRNTQELSIIRNKCDLARRTTLGTRRGRNYFLTDLEKSSTTMNNTPQTGETFEINVVRFRPRDLPPRAGWAGGGRCS